jgi:hypothetical protein
MNADDADFLDFKMIRLNFDEYEIELMNESSYTFDSVNNISKYDFVYQDEESEIYQSTKHGIKVFKDEKLHKSAVVCATGGATGIHENSAVIFDEDILICCAGKVFSLSLPDLNLNWMKQVDDATCFRIFKTETGLFVHGEINASRIDSDGNIIWSQSFADILVTPDGRDEFIMHKDFIEIEDWNHDKYKLNFDGKFI